MTTAVPIRIPRLIVALDVPTYDAAVGLVDVLAPLDVTFKLGLESLYGYGDRIRAEFERRATPVFIDAKIHDVPRTAAAAVRALVRPGVALLNVHALGGAEMLFEAVDAAHARAAELGIPAPEVFGVTLLTSHDGAELGELGLVGGPGENVMRLAALARDARCAGVVCGVAEVADLKGYFGHDFRALCPGIRPLGTLHQDQKRVATPAAAALAGADYVVVGRPIVDAPDALQAARAIVAEMTDARDAG